MSPLGREAVKIEVLISGRHLMGNRENCELLSLLEIVADAVLVNIRNVDFMAEFMTSV